MIHHGGTDKKEIRPQDQAKNRCTPTERALRPCLKGNASELFALAFPLSPLGYTNSGTAVFLVGVFSIIGGKFWCRYLQSALLVTPQGAFSDKLRTNFFSRNDFLVSQRL